MGEHVGVKLFGRSPRIRREMAVSDLTLSATTDEVPPEQAAVRRQRRDVHALGALRCHVLAQGHAGSGPFMATDMAALLARCAGS